MLDLFSYIWDNIATFFFCQTAMYKITTLGSKYWIRLNAECKLNLNEDKWKLIGTFTT